ncbi:S-adenosyl-L-methionine-dependent methyltransferase [Coniella lustricola]|uniref:Protein arginine methyltransferase NDUFAF7 n=1 Tax=Coniella lustricola TaxID=2025994 RepID=A0A2T3A9W8_9PEZI|nr:S-adenosyl-L-methionine-dependent methyltransferase [Coniella lustricola]
MDSPIVTQLFRQLFRHRHPACHARRSLSSTLAPALHHRRQLRQLSSSPSSSARSSSNSRGRGATALSESEKERGWQQRHHLLPKDKSAEARTYPTVTARDLRQYKERPRRVKMLLRDFIEDSLYNPHYGYFSKQVVIFSPGEPFDFPAVRDELEFHAILSRRYTEFEDSLDATSASDTRQLWYTPTELFRPYYGEAIARYLCENYKHTNFPYHDLIIYEMGAGRGTLMLNILDYIRDCEPEVYERTRYKIIEISSNLATVQQSSLAATAASRGHLGKVEIINKSIFDWRDPVPSPCFFLAFEVFDNFAHDVLRYDLATEQPLEGTVLIDEDGDFYEFYGPVTDPTIARFLRLRHVATEGIYPLPYHSRSGMGISKHEPVWTRGLRRMRESLRLQYDSNGLSEAEYIPTRLMAFFEVLERYFPNHQLVTSDFHSLPDAIPGLNGPIVQTRYQRTPVPVSTPLVHQGYFDIMFPTDFVTMEAVYRSITGKLSRVWSHEDFMRSWAFIEDCETRNGENPLLSWYKNASVMMTWNYHKM